MSVTVELIDEAGNTQNLSNGTLTEFIALEGAGVASVRRVIEDGPNIHGALDRGFRLEPRQMTLILTFEDDRTGTADSTRDTLAKVFGPTLNPFNLKVTRDDAAIRQIDCFLDGKIEYQQASRSQVGRQDVLIPLIALDPSWYLPTQQTDTADLSGGSGQFSESASGLTWEDWPIFEATGPLTDLLISHQDLAASIQFLGATIPGGETYTIDTRPAHKTILDSSNNSQMGKVSSITGMFSEPYIAPEKYLDAYGGGATSNIINFTATSTTGASEIVTKWYKRYLNL